jgi:hypothetical protein
MMSTANLMAVGIKQPDVPSIVPDRGDIKSGSFAQSFDEGVKAAAASPSDTFAGEAHRLLSVKNCAEGSVEITGETKGLQEKGISGPDTATGGGQTGTKTLGAKTAGTETAEKVVASAAPPKTSGSINSASKTEDEVPIPASREATDELPLTANGTLSPQVSLDKLSEASRERNPVVHGVAVVSSSRAVAVGAELLQEEKVVSNKAEQAVPSKKPEKTQHLAKQGVVQGTGFSTANLSAINAVPVMGGAGQVEMPVGGARDIGLQDGVDDAPKIARMEAGSQINYAATGSVENTRGTVSDPDNAATVKSSTMEPAIASGLEKAVSARAPEAVEKASGASASDTGEIDSRVQGTAGAAPTGASALVSSVTSTVGVSVSPAPHAQIGSAAAVQKTHAGEDIAHGAGLQAGVGELNGHTSAPPMDSSPRMLMATPTSLEVGIQNGTHGWLRVRAEITDGGSVSASVSTASSAGQEMLHRELPALTAYLQQEKVAVSTVVIHAPPPQGIGYRNSASEMGGGLAQQRDSEGGKRQQNAEQPVGSRIGETTGYAGLNPMNEEGVLSTVMYPAGGGWLSVRA